MSCSVQTAVIATSLRRNGLAKTLRQPKVGGVSAMPPDNQPPAQAAKHMPNVEEPFAYYLDRLLNGDGEAVFGLMELGPDALPLIEKAIASVQNSAVRQDLVHVAWQTRVPAALKILESSMNDPSPAVWKEAIDGLVCLGSPEA